MPRRVKQMLTFESDLLDKTMASTLSVGPPLALPFSLFSLRRNVISNKANAMQFHRTLSPFPNRSHRIWAPLFVLVAAASAGAQNPASPDDGAPPPPLQSSGATTGAQQSPDTKAAAENDDETTAAPGEADDKASAEGDAPQADAPQADAPDAPLIGDQGRAAPPSDPTTESDDHALEARYSGCIENEADAHDPQQCLRDLASDVPETKVGQRAQTVLDAIAVMKRSGIRLEPSKAPTPDGPESESEGPKENVAAVSFDSVVSRVPATVTGVGYGLALGIGGGIMLGTSSPALGAGLPTLAGGVVAVGGAVGFGTLGFWLSGPNQFGGEGSWLGSGGLFAGASVGIAAGVATIDVIQSTLTLQQLDQFGPSVIIGAGLIGAAAGAAGGFAAAAAFDLDNDQVAVANGMLSYGAMLGGALALASGSTYSAVAGFNGSLTVASLTYMGGLAAAAGASVWVVPNLNFNAGEVLVSTLAMLATSGVMFGAASLSANSLGLGTATGGFIGGSTAVAGSVGFLGTAAILYLLRDDMRPLFRKMETAGIQAHVGPPTLGLDRRGEAALMSPVIGLSY